MENFILKELKNTDFIQELENIGFDKSYRSKACEKYQYKNFKIFGVSVAQANILKQTALSFGADCATCRDVVTGNCQKSDCILGGSISELRKISQNLKFQPFGLKNLAKILEENLDFKLHDIKIKEKTFDFTKPYIVGVVNITKNSFSDGGEFFELDKAKSHILELIKDGADIIELGAESTKPFSKGVSEKNQLEKLLPLLDFIKKEDMKIPVSIDTRSANVARECLKSDADIINDVSGFKFDKNMAKTCAEFNCPVILQHSQGTPESMQISPKYENLTDEIFLDLKKCKDYAISCGINSENIILDVGIGFGKTKKDNFELIKRAEEFSSLECPLMFGVSRKSLLGMPDAPNSEKDIFTLAINSILLTKGINFIRVHNVKLTKKLIDMLFEK